MATSTKDTSDDSTRYNKRGQRLGAKGIATRNAILETTLELLRSIPLWQLTPSDVTQACHIQQSNFYTYFDSVEEVVLAIAQRARKEAPELMREFPGDLTGDAGLLWLKRFVEAYIVAWESYGPALRIAEILADDNVPEFREARQGRLILMMDAFMAVLRRAQAAGSVPAEINPRLVSFSTLSIMRVVAEHYNVTRAYPMSHDEIVTTAARMAQLLLTGQTVCADTNARFETNIRAETTIRTETKKPPRVDPTAALKAKF